MLYINFDQTKMSYAISYIILKNTNDGSNKFWACLRIASTIGGTNQYRTCEITHWGKIGTVGQCKYIGLSGDGAPAISQVAAKKINEGYVRVCGDLRVGGMTKQQIADELNTFFGALPAIAISPQGRMGKYCSEFLAMPTATNQIYADVIQSYQSAVMPLIGKPAVAQPVKPVRVEPEIDRAVACNGWGAF